LFWESAKKRGRWEASNSDKLPSCLTHQLLLLTTVGRRSGEKRTSPLFYGTAGDAYVIIGSKGGADTHPGWYLNLRANPTAEVQVGREHFTVRARVATGKEREQLFEQMAQMAPPYRDYQQKTQRELPVVVLEKQPPST
jgi:deazaflavin-dependent oxidoreductase (nitroreductase family)